MQSVNKVLAADKPEGIQTLRNILSGHADILSASTLSDAAAMLNGQSVDLILCGIHFDDSRMFDLLGLARQSARTKDIPFLVFRDMANQLDQTFSKSIEIAAMLLGAIGFIDLFSLKQNFGIVEAYEQFRRLVLEQLHGKKDTQNRG